MLPRHRKLSRFNEPHAASTTFVLHVFFFSLRSSFFTLLLSRVRASRCPRRTRRVPPMGPLAVSAYRCANVHAQHVRSPRRERRRRCLPFPVPTWRRQKRQPRCPGTRHSLFRPLQSLARQPVALRSGGRGSHRSGNQHRESKQTRDQLNLPARKNISQSAHVDMVTDARRRPDVGANSIRKIVPHDVFADALRHWLLHLPAIRSRYKSVATDSLVE